MSRKGLIWSVIGTLALLVAFAWIDGGEREMREISVPVAIPGAAK